ncbi:hypothetical protein [Thermobifida halotolerans]|nr:hypothetical protein [Thermobifida halotolerans]
MALVNRHENQYAAADRADRRQKRLWPALATVGATSDWRAWDLFLR